MEWLRKIFFFLFLISTVAFAEGPLPAALRPPRKPIEGVFPESVKNAQAAVQTAAANATNTLTNLVNTAAAPQPDPSASLDPVAPTPAAQSFPPTVQTAPPVETAPATPPVAETRAPASATNTASLPPAAEAAVILSQNQFYPSKIAMPQGTRVRIWFTTVETKPAALIVEGLKMQRWIASENSELTGSASQGYFELQRELSRERVTEITLQPSAGTYPFYDALSGARGEIVVE